MNIRIQTQSFTLTPAIAAWVHERLGRALERFTGQVLAVDVYLKDVNGPKGGNDKQALVRVQLRGGSPVLTESAHADMYAAIDLSARMAKRAVRRLHKRRQGMVRGESRRMRYIRTLVAEL